MGEEADEIEILKMMITNAKKSTVSKGDVKEGVILHYYIEQITKPQAFVGLRFYALL